MNKMSDYGIEFKTHISPSWGTTQPWFDTKNALLQYRSLSFINSLSRHEVEGLIEDMDRIITGQLYDPDFLTSSEIYGVFNVQFINPHFLVDGYKVINIVDLRALLWEWVEFLEHFEKGREQEQPKQGF